MLLGRTVLITGASSGIGAACAAVLAGAGMRLILNARREERLRDMAQSLLAEHGCETHIVPFDVGDESAVKQAIAALPAAWRDIDVLINNAGLARGLAPLHEGLSADWDEMLATNVHGLLNVTRTVVPTMVTRHKGDVVNIGSIAGREVYPRGAVYCASKHAVRALTQGLRIDLLGTGVRVTSIDPGLVETEFSLVRFHGDYERARATYQKFVPLKPIDIAETVRWCLERPAHVTINEVLIMPTHQANAANNYSPSGGRAQAERELGE